MTENRDKRRYWGGGEDGCVASKEMNYQHRIGK